MKTTQITRSAQWSTPTSLIQSIGKRVQFVVHFTQMTNKSAC